jgi:hypothetical protein
MGTWILLRFDADVSCNDCCRPLEGIASFTGFDDERDILKFIVMNPKRKKKCTEIYNALIYGLAWYDTRDMDFSDDDDMIMEMDERLSKMDKYEIVDRLENFLNQCWRENEINSFLLVPKKEKLFKMFRTLKGDMYRDLCYEFHK